MKIKISIDNQLKNSHKASIIDTMNDNKGTSAMPPDTAGTHSFFTEKNEQLIDLEEKLSEKIGSSQPQSVTDEH